MSTEILRESHEPPARFVEQLRNVGGINRFGTPNFDVVWSGHADAMVTIDGELRPMYHGKPCWLLRMWKPPEDYGTPAFYYALHGDGAGAWPAKGRYEIIQPLTLCEVVNGTLAIDVLPLSEFVLQMVAIIRGSQDSTHEERLSALKELRDAEDQRQQDRIADSLQAAMPAFEGNSFSALGGLCTNTVQRKMELIERSMGYAAKMYKSRGKGVSVN